MQPAPSTSSPTFEGERVAARGKLIDLRPEGFDREIWIGTLDLDPGGGPRGEGRAEQ